ncbi:hypothetical protein M406DRAFT_100686, partial [Cryphonectria parasitica EP155]
LELGLSLQILGTKLLLYKSPQLWPDLEISRTRFNAHHQGRPRNPFHCNAFPARTAQSLVHTSTCSIGALHLAG